MPLSIRSLVASSLVLSCLGFSASIARADSVLGAIQKKYVVTELSLDHEQITKDGTVMELKSAGVYSMPVGIRSPELIVADGKIQPPGRGTKMGLEMMGAKVLQSGDKVYITKIDTKEDGGDEFLRFTLSTVNSLDVKGQNVQKKFTAVVSFKFKKGYLEDNPPSDVEEVVEKVMTPDTDSGSSNASGAAPSNPAGPAPRGASGPPPRSVSNPPTPTPAPPSPPPAVASSEPPPTISIGEARADVVEAMGKPTEKSIVGKKQIYIYPTMKITFIDDKVTAMEPG